MDPGLFISFLFLRLSEARLQPVGWKGHRAADAFVRFDYDAYGLSHVSTIQRWISPRRNKALQAQHGLGKWGKPGMEQLEVHCHPGVRCAWWLW